MPRTKAAAVAAAVVNPAAAAAPPEGVVDKVADAQVAEAVAVRVVAVVDVPPVAVVDKVAADAHRVVEAEAAKVVVVRAAAVADVPLVVGGAVDKEVAEAAVAQVVGAAADFRAVADREVEEGVVDVLPAVAAAGAAETVNSLSSSGASRVRGAPLFY